MLIEVFWTLCVVMVLLLVFLQIKLVAVWGHVSQETWVETCRRNTMWYRTMRWSVSNMFLFTPAKIHREGWLFFFSSFRCANLKFYKLSWFVWYVKIEQFSIFSSECGLAPYCVEHLFHCLAHRIKLSSQWKTYGTTQMWRLISLTWWREE